jgi:hypothetical protein
MYPQLNRWMTSARPWQGGAEMSREQMHSRRDDSGRVKFKLDEDLALQDAVFARIAGAGQTMFPPWRCSA